MRWLRPLGYELDVDQALVEIITLLAEEIDKDAKHFRTYEIVKSRVVTDLKTTIVVKKKDKFIKKIKKRFGVEEVGTTEEEEADEEEDGNENKEDEPLKLKQGPDEDKEEGAKEE